MPSFDYKCNKCGEPFEVFVKTLSEDRDTTCPQCMGSDTQRIFSPLNIGTTSSLKVDLPEKCHGCSSSGMCGGM